MAKGQKSSSAIMNCVFFFFFFFFERDKLILFQYLNQNPFISTGIYWQDQRFEPKFMNVSEHMFNFEQSSTPEDFGG